MIKIAVEPEGGHWPDKGGSCPPISPLPRELPATITKPAKKKIEKRICDWSKREFREHFEQLSRIISRPRYGCTKCGRAASAKKWLCKPEELQ